MKRRLSKFIFMTLLLWGSMNVLAYETASSLVTSCPAEAEITTLHKDFNIVFKNLDPDYRCTPTGKSNRQLAAYNILRLLKDTNFTQPLPWAAYTSPYEWLKSLKLQKIVFSDGDGSSAGANAIYISGAMFNKSGREYRTDAYQLLLLSGVLLHEARHTVPGGSRGHTGDCRQGSDATLSEMGTWAVQYHYFRLLREDTGNYLSQRTKDLLKVSTDAILQRSICENYSAYLEGKDFCFAYRRSQLGTIAEECYETRDRCEKFLKSRKTIPEMSVVHVCTKRRQDY